MYEACKYRTDQQPTTIVLICTGDKLLRERKMQYNDKGKKRRGGGYRGGNREYHCIKPVKFIRIPCILDVPTKDQLSWNFDMMPSLIAIMCSIPPALCAISAFMQFLILVARRRWVMGGSAFRRHSQDV